MKDVGGNVTRFCKHIVHSIGGFVALVTISDTYAVPGAPQTFFCSTQGPPLVPQ